MWILIWKYCGHRDLSRSFEDATYYLLTAWNRAVAYVRTTKASRLGIVIFPSDYQDGILGLVLRITLDRPMEAYGVALCISAVVSNPLFLQPPVVWSLRGREN